ncbi:N-acetylmuramic acid 6-phosphate etherase [Amaricoccus sp.]|uniref:N-acetylmuramic acid 6-phosphate etherase n=1 Tax=Amaricoccus sp. TaxID=1872485 RepID=UPI0026270CDA|nr:N-acetylmuramic acid 6-phosphate etherase [Amaricoccus sp.]HRO12297.1 N-acetylmuramic acid 6-phosphate etherase [Amaricoccus sp.]
MPLPATEARHPGAIGIQSLPAPEILARLLDGHRHAAEQVAAALPEIEAAAEAAARALAAGKRLAYAGAGSAGLMALSDALELLGTFGIAPERTPVLFAGGAAALAVMRGDVEDVAADGAADVARAGLGPGDVLICVSASGTTPYTLAAAAAGRAAGARVVGVANVAGSALLAAADVAVLLDTGPELVAGSTRLGAGTAQKIALNLVSTLVGIRLGHVHDGYMVNLTADNAKLRRRAAGIVAAVAGCDAAAAEAALAAAGGRVKPAVLIAAGAEGAEAARRLLAASGGQLGPALAALAGR